MAADGSIIIDTKIDDKDMKKDLTEIKKNINTGISAAMKAGAVAVAGMTAAIAVLSRQTVAFAEATDRVDKLSQKIGISQEAFQEWDFILSQNGASINVLQTGMKTLASAADKSTQGTNEQSKALERLGISVLDVNGNMKSQEQLFNEVFSSLANLESETERTALASTLLGRSATELAPAFNSGAEAIEGLREKAHDLGLVMDADVISIGVELTDSMDTLGRSIKALTIEAFAPFAEGIKNASNALIDFIRESKKAQTESDLLHDVFSNQSDNFAAAVDIQKKKIEEIENARENDRTALKKLARQYDFNTRHVDEYVEGLRIELRVLEGNLERQQAKQEADRKAAEEKLNQAEAEREASQALKEYLDLVDKEYAKTADGQIIALQEQIALWEDYAKTAVNTAPQVQSILKMLRNDLEALTGANEEGETAVDSYAESLRKQSWILQQIDKELKSGKMEQAISSAGIEMGQTLMDSIILGMQNNFQVINEAKLLMSNIGGAIQQGASLIGGALNFMADFDPVESYEDIKDFIDGIVDFFETDLGTIPTFFDMVVGDISDALTTLTDELDLAEIIGNVIESVSETIIKDGPDIIKDVLKVLTSVVVAIGNNADKLIEAAGEMILALGEGLVENLPDIIDSVVQVVVSLITYFSENLGQFITLGIEMMLAITSGLIDNLDIILVAIIGALPDIIVAFMMLQPMLLKAGIEMAPDLIWGLIKGITAAIPALIDAVAELFTDFIDSVLELFGIHSPSTVFADMGSNIIQGLIDGLIDAGSGIWDSIKSIFTGIIDSIADIFSGAFDLGKDLINGITDGIESAIDDVGDFFGDIGSTANNIFDDVGDFIGGFFANGTDNAPGGVSVVGERGPELVNLPGGSSVLKASDTEKIMSSAAGVIGALANMSSGGMSGAASMTIMNRMVGVMEVDGRAIAQIVYENLDEVAG